MFPPWLLLSSLFAVTLFCCRRTKKTQSEAEPSVESSLCQKTHFQKKPKHEEKVKRPVATPSPAVKKPEASLIMKTAVLKTEKELEFGTCQSEKEPEKTDLDSVDESHNPLMDKAVQSRLMLAKTRSQATLEKPLPVQKTQQDESTKTAKEMPPVCERSEHVASAMRSKRGEKVKEKAVGAKTSSPDSSDKDTQ